MARALELAWRGWGRVQPNPMVGAVVLSGGRPIAEGWHAEYGEAHAERAALAMAGERARGATVVVTLEPCSHFGKQPPCTGALIDAGVRRVVAAIPDPDPDAAGGADRLREAGIEVETGLMAKEARAQNAIFLRRFSGARRPFVALKLATSLDGRIADADGRSKWISGPEARDWVQWLRAGYDAIAVGAGTARADDPVLTVRGALVPRRVPLRVVFDRQGLLPPTLRLVRTARETPTVVLALPDAAVRDAALADAGVEILTGATLDEQLAALHRRGVESLLVEGGGRLASALLAAGLVDRYYWVQSPVWLGGHGVAAAAGLPNTSIDSAPRWRVTERRALGNDTLLVVDRA